MSIPTEKAYELLNLPLGSSKDAIEQSYKRLAFKWHPEKYSTTKNTQEALKKFKSVNVAYRKLIYNERDDKEITLTEMFEQYRQVFNSDKKKEKYLNNISNNNTVGQTFFDIKNSSHTNSTDNNNNTNHSIELNNLNKMNGHHYITNGGNDVIYLKNVQSSNMNAKLKLLNDKNNNNDEENYENQYQSLRRDERIDQNLLTIKLKVKALAIKGVELAKQNEFAKAIEKFSEAIKNDSTDHRLYGNRSYCYDKINNFNEALNDAEKAIILDPMWPKGYFRKGRALSGLKMYKEAEDAYLKVLEIENPNDPELDEELLKVRSCQLQEMGFSKIQSENAIKNHSTVEAALESLILCNSSDNTSSNKNDKSNESCSDIDNNEYDYNENDSEYGDEYANSLNNKKMFQQLNNLNINSHLATTNITSSTTNGISYKEKLKTNTNGSNNHFVLSSNGNKLKINKSNNNNNTIDNKNTSNTNGHGNLVNGSQNIDQFNLPVGNNNPVSTSLWIGNVDPNVSEDVLVEMFSAYGPLANVRCLPEKYCAFVNFKVKEDAQKALQNLQGKYLEGQKLLIKYPDNPNTALLSSIVTKKVIETKKPSENVTMIGSGANKLKKKPVIQQEEVQVASSNKNDPTNQNGIKLTGPVNGNECYFWRTTGCLYADKCRYEHIKKNKGIDKKPWHK